MASNVTTVNIRGRGQGQGRQRGDRRQLIRAAAAANPEWFQPERSYLAARAPELARLQQGLKFVTAVVNAEKNFYDVSGNVNPVVTPTAQYLNGIAQGDDDSSRAGSTIRAKELTVRMHFYAGTASTNSITVRVFIVKDNDPRGSVPAVGTLFQGGTASVDGMPVLDTSQGRFKWIFDETFVLDSAAGGNAGKVVVVNQKLDYHINFINNTATTASAGQGTLWLFVLTDIATPAPTGTFYSRLRYYDN